MNVKGKTSSKESNTKITAATLLRLAGVSAMLAGICILVIGMYHPVNESSAVTTAAWVNVHIFATALGFFGLFGLAGLYVRQVEKAGWMGLAGFLLFSLWLGLTMPFSFVEAFILPRLTTTSPEFVEALLGMFSGATNGVDLGVLPTLWTISNPMYLLGPLLFGIATFRAGILPRWAGALLIVGATLGPVSALLMPAEHQAKVMLPNGLALLWMGYAVLAERRVKVSEALLEQRAVKAEPGNAA